jgi:5-methylcytosine-specific restriction endonuclease McrA
LKRCAICRLPKPLKAFNKDSKQKDGLELRCKPCDRAKVAKWAKNNPGKNNAKGARRRAAKMKRRPPWIKEIFKEQVDEFYTMAKELENIFPWKQHVDHKTPLQGKYVSGLDVPWNLEILSEKANLEKGNRYVDESNAPSLSEGHYHNGRVYTQFGVIPSTWTGQDNNNSYHHSGADAGKDTDHRAKESSRDSMGHRGQEVGPLETPQSFEDHGNPQLSFSWT